MDLKYVLAWVTAYERAWRSPGTSALGELFTADAVYRQGPYEEPVVGLPAIAAMWEDTRDGPAEVFRMTSEVIAVDADTAVVGVEVHYGEPVQREYRDLWIVRFADSGLCRSFEEWPFWPGKPYTATDEDKPDRD